MSDLLQKLKYAVQSAKSLAKDVIEGNEIKVSDEVFNQRMGTCHGCPKFIKETNQCGECGCFLAVKARGASFECPLKKWGKYPNA